MTDGRKRNTGGEVERYEPEIVPDPDKPYIHFHYDPEGRWMLYHDHNRALAESRAECARQAAYAKRTHDWNTELHARAERLAGALRDARDYVTSELSREREAFKGYERCSDIPSIEADLAKIDAALNLEPTP